MSALGDHERTIAYANLALGKIKDLGQPGDPRTFAAWFAYATNCNPSQNIVVNEALARKGSISAADLEKIYGYAPADRMTEKVDDLAASLADEVDQVMAMIDVAAGKVANCRNGIINVARELDRARHREGVRTIVDGLVQAAESMQATNGSLNASLKTSKQEIRQLRQKIDSLRIDNLTDALTRLANRKHFDRELERCMAEPSAAQEGMCLLLMDIDRFKRVNDTFGHVAGDEVLRAVAHALEQHVQPDDLAARVGGEEFAVILTNARLPSALTVADHVRCRVMAMQFMKRSTGENIGRVTISGGIASYRAGEAPWTLMQRADNCLYAAKRQGRNRVICDDDEPAAGTA